MALLIETEFVSVGVTVATLRGLLLNLRLNVGVAEFRSF
jgi:hypothetical protein